MPINSSSLKQPATFLLLLLLSDPSIQSTVKCYFPNHSQMPTPYQVCANNPDDGNVHACCGASDNCLANGLCRNSFGYNYRGGCTDDQWGDDCPVACSKVDTDDFTDLFTCPQTAAKGWCCGLDGGCCDESDRVLSLTNLGVVSYASDPNASSSTTDSSSSISSASTASSTNTSTSEGKNATKIGAAVGVPLGLLAIAGWSAALFLYFRRPGRTGQQSAGAGGMEYQRGYQEALGGHGLGQLPVVKPELDSTSRGREVYEVSGVGR